VVFLGGGERIRVIELTHQSYLTRPSLALPYEAHRYAAAVRPPSFSYL
jgi:hypothetical protein